MTKKRIRWIAILMTAGLLGLISLQLYWIKSALSLQREQFDYKVTDALQEVVRTLERQEILYLARQRLSQQQQQQRLMAITRPAVFPPRRKPYKPSSTQRTEQGDNLAQQGAFVRPSVQPTRLGMNERRSWQQGQVSPSDVLHADFQRLSDLQQRNLEEFLHQQDALEPDELWRLQIQQHQQFSQMVDEIFHRQLGIVSQVPVVDSAASQSVVPPKPVVVQKRRSTPVDLSKPTIQSVQHEQQIRWQKAERQSEIVKGMVKELLFANRSIRSRVNRIILDSLLKETMLDRGITIPFEYGVRTNVGVGLAKPQVLFASHSIHQSQGDKKVYKAVLFPNNLFEKGNYVYVYFPDQQKYILQKMSAILAGSAVLILVIMACFYVAISTIVRQKKLADIKNDFINNMTHEFKTPISTISLAIEMLQDQLWVESGEAGSFRLTRYMSIIRDETKRLSMHVEKVLQMALLDRGPVKLKLSSVNIHDTIGNVLNTIGLQIEQKGGELHLDFEAEQEIIQADEVHLSNILSNLFDNAIKYSLDHPIITIRTRSLEQGVSITIVDRGIGMSQEEVGRVFEKFYRVPTGNLHNVKGFGLGLSYVKKMVEEHHGTIHVDSRPGVGTTFEIVLPYQHV